jgi:hypothetical protein
MPVTITVNGLKELQRSLKNAEDATPKMLRLALNDVTGIVLDYARPQVPTRSGAAKGSMKARSTQREARIQAGGTRAPYYPWLDFGGHVGRGGGVARPFFKEGRYIYPTLRQKHPEIIEAAAAALAGLIRDAGLEVT